MVVDSGIGESRDSVAAVRALAVGGYRPVVTVGPRPSLASRSRHCAERVRIPPVTDDGYAQAVRAVRAKGSYVACLPASEGAVLALGAAVPELLDKVVLHERATSVGLQVPPSRVFSAPAALIDEGATLDYPVVVKPTHRLYSAFRATAAAELTQYPMGEGPVIAQPYLEDPLHAVAGVVWNGRLVAALHERWLRVWPWPCGLACAAESIAPDCQLEERLLGLLEGYEGIFCAQLAGPYLFDLNLRIHSSHPLGVAAGTNLAALFCDLKRGMDVSHVRARPGVFFRWIEGDFRNLTSAARAGRIAPASMVKELLPRRRAAHSTESLADPLPGLTRLSFAATRARRNG